MNTINFSYLALAGIAGVLMLQHFTGLGAIVLRRMERMSLKQALLVQVGAVTGRLFWLLLLSVASLKLGALQATERFTALVEQWPAAPPLLGACMLGIILWMLSRQGQPSPDQTDSTWGLRAKLGLEWRSFFAGFLPATSPSVLVFVVFIVSALGLLPKTLLEAAYLVTVAPAAGFAVWGTLLWRLNRLERKTIVLRYAYRTGLVLVVALMFFLAYRAISLL